MFRHIAAVLAAIAMLTAAPAAFAEDDGWRKTIGDRAADVAVVFDLVVLRPLNLGATVVGAVYYGLSVPLLYPHEGLDTAFDIFVYAPYEYTFHRELGDF